MNLSTIIPELAALAGKVGGLLGGDTIGGVVEIAQQTVKLIGQVKATLGEKDAAKLSTALTALEAQVAAHHDRVMAKLDAASKR